MLVCATCGGRYAAATFAETGCPLCGDALVELTADLAPDGAEPVEVDVTTRLRQRLLGVGA